MKITRLLAVIGVILLLAAPAAFSKETEEEDAREYKFTQGVINRVDGSLIVLNEKLRVYLGRDTAYFDDHGRQVPSADLRESKYVYIEGPVSPDGSVKAEKVYSLPGLIGKKDRRKYPFIQQP